jgi:histone H3/H4
MSEDKTAEVVVVASKVKAAIKAAGFKTSGDSVDALNRYIYWLIAEACARADANGRKTVRGYDFLAGR